jgi:hypothetical protein
MAQQTDNPADENGYPLYGTFRQQTKQQTAVEWFYQRILAEDIKTVFEQAKAMEKEQIINAHGTKVSRTIKQGIDIYQTISGEKYYNETYKK